MTGHTIRRSSHLLALLCCLPAITLGADDDLTPKIEGAWKMIGQLTDSGEIRQTGMQATKFIIGGQWCVTAVDANSGDVVFHHGGTYTFDGEKYVENVKYAAALQSAANLGQAFEFNITFDGNRLTQKGIGNPYDEVWERYEVEDK